MKKLLLKLIALVVASISLLGCVACGPGDNDDDTPPTPTCNHDYVIVEDVPHVKATKNVNPAAGFNETVVTEYDPDEYGHLVYKCTKCEDTYNKYYRGHSIKGCNMRQFPSSIPTDLTICSECGTKEKTIENHTCLGCGTLCDPNVIYTNNAIFGAYKYINDKGEAKWYMPRTYLNKNNPELAGPRVELASVVRGRPITKILSNSLNLNSQYRYIMILPGLLETIGDDSLSYANSMPGIWLPKTIKEIGKKAFYENEKFYDIYYEGTLMDWKNVKLVQSWNGMDSPSPSGCDKIGGSDGKTSYPGKGDGCWLRASDGNLKLN